MSYEQAVAYLDALGVDAMKSLKPSLHRIEALCELLNHPERAIPAVHVGGTNGKTSTVRIAASLLSAAGLSVGTYTSPHLQSVRERIALNGHPLSKADFGEAFDHLSPYLQTIETSLGESLSYFEVLTAMFFLWAADTPVDVMVVEVGLGGRWDATNVLASSTSVLTNVALDHVDLLGSDRATIAKEKVGIVKQGSEVVMGERSPEIVEILMTEVSGKEARASIFDRDFYVTNNHVAIGGRLVSVMTTSGEYEDLYLPLHGAHQAVNAGLALEAVTRFSAHPFSQELVTEGFARVEVPGRLETIRLEEREATVILDVAHNPEGSSALVSALGEGFAFDRIVFVVGILTDKDHRGILTELGRLPCLLVVTEARNERSVRSADLLSEATTLGLQAVAEPDVVSAIESAISLAIPGDLICVTGSHYVVGEARTHLLNPLD